MFAGPNGSGKTTLIEDINKRFNIGYFINADNIEALLESQQHLDCSGFFPEPIFPEELEMFLSNYKDDKRFSSVGFSGISIKKTY